MARRRSGSDGWMAWALVGVIVFGVVAYAGYRQWMVSRAAQQAQVAVPPPQASPPPKPQPTPQIEQPAPPPRQPQGPFVRGMPPEPGVLSTIPPEPQAPPVAPPQPLRQPVPEPIPQPAPVPVPPAAAPPKALPTGPIVLPGNLPAVGSTNLFLGNPSLAAGTDANNLLIGHTGFVLSYNASHGTPNWVSWRLRKEDLGDAPRARYFSADEFLVKHNLTAIEHKDYTNSGFDRGHLCPRSDRDATKESSYETFLMTNIIPQSPTLNQKPWADLEDHLRLQVVDGKKSLYIVAGGVGKGGSGKNGPATTIAGGKVTVPAKCWKVVVMVSGIPAKPTDIGQGGATAQTLAVMMPNVETVGLDWTKYRVTIAEVEKETGYSFLGALRPEVAARLRTAK